MERGGRVRRTRLAALILPALLLAAASLAEPVPLPRLDAVISDWVGRGEIVGAVVMVARDGEIIYRRADGHADREAEIRVTEDTIFRLASMTKAIVSATALALAAERRLALDDPVRKWLPYFAPQLEDGQRPDIRIRQLLTHTSGLSYAFLEPQDSPYAVRHIESGLELSRKKLEEALRELAAVPLVFAPGTEWRYSLSTDVLGAVVAAAAGVPLPAAVEHYVTGPLDMRDTVFGVTDISRLAAAYRDGAPRPARMCYRFNALPLQSRYSRRTAFSIRTPTRPAGGESECRRHDEHFGRVAGVIGDFPAQVRDAIYADLRGRPPVHTPDAERVNCNRSALFLPAISCQTSFLALA